MDYKKIYIELREKGFILLSVNALTEFKQLCSQIGSVVKYTDVKINNKKPWYLNKPNAFPFHTDDPEINIVSWFCITQDKIDGSINLIDVRSIFDKIDKGSLDTLKSIYTNIQILDKASPLVIGITPLKLYYAPWNIKRNSLSSQQKQELNCFELEIQNLKKEKLIKIKLCKNQVLIINNNFILHGREEISKDSKRHLVRAYIKSEKV